MSKFLRFLKRKPKEEIFVSSDLPPPINIKQFGEPIDPRSTPVTKGFTRAFVKTFINYTFLDIVRFGGSAAIIVAFYIYYVKSDRHLRENDVTESIRNTSKKMSNVMKGFWKMTDEEKEIVMNKLKEKK